MGKPAEWHVTQDILDEITETILAAGSPMKIVLFGSRARGDARPDSDIDILIIADAADRPAFERVERRWTIPTDVKVVTPNEVAAWREVPNYFLTRVLREGRVLFERTTDLIRESVPPKTHADHAREWLDIADRQLRDGQLLLGAGGSAESICFAAQQAIETSLKAVLAFFGSDIPRTHDLETLRKLVAKWVVADPAIDLLTKPAIDGRYGKGPPPTGAFARQAIELARQIRRRVDKVLPPPA